MSSLSLRERFENGSVFRSSFLDSGGASAVSAQFYDKEFPMMSSQLLLLIHKLIGQPPRRVIDLGKDMK